MKIKNSLCLIISVIFALVYSGCEQNNRQVGQDKNILELVGRLDGNQPEEVAKAIEEIALIGPKADVAVPALMRKIKDRDFSVKYNAKKALVAIGPKAATAIVQSDDEEIIGEYILLLDGFGAVGVNAIMAEASRTKNSQKMMMLLMTLPTMGESAKNALPMIKKMHANAKMKNNAQAEAFFSYLETQIEEGEEGVKKLIEKTKQESIKIQGRVNELNQEFRDMVERAAKFTFSINPPKAKILMEQYGKDLSKALPEIEKMITSEEVSERVTASAVIFKYCSDNEGNIEIGLPIVKKLCSDVENPVRLLSCLVANKLGDKTDYSAEYIKAIKLMDNPTEILLALGGLFENKTMVKDPEAVAAMKVFLEIRNPEINMASAVVLVNSGFGEDVLDFAEKLIGSSSEQSKVNGLALIVKIGNRARSLIPKMRVMQKAETNEEIKAFIGMAIESLGKLENDLDGLIEKTKTSDRVTRYDAFEEMKKLSSEKKKDSITYLLKVIQDGNEDIRDLALSTLCSYGVDAEPAFDALIKIMEYAIANNKTDMQFKIAHVFAEIGKGEAASVLLDVIEKGNDASANSASIALKKLGPKAKSIVPALLELAKDPKYTEDLFMVLREIKILEGKDQIDTVASFLSRKQGIVAFSAAEVLAAQSPEICIPVFKRVIVEEDDDITALNGMIGLLLMGRIHPQKAIVALGEAKLSVSSPKRINAIEKSIEDLKKLVK